MKLALLVALLVQQPQVQGTVDRRSVAPGDTVTLTIRVTGRGNDPIRIGNPGLTGLELVDQRESSRVQMVDGTAERVTIRVLRLRAGAGPRAAIGRARIDQAGRVVETDAIALDITSVAEPAALDISVKQVLDRLAPPANLEQVSVQTVPSRRSVALGDQVDVVTVAWFPRDVRTRLRTVPSFEGADVQGAWSYQQAGPAGVAASRRVGDAWYDLYVQFQTVFPLQAGAIRIGRATVSYSLPVTYSFLSRELRHVVQSDSITLDVAPFPAAGRPVRFRGAAGGGLTLEVQPIAQELAVGEARTVTVGLRGRGNVSLWPEPEIRWPPGLRAYPGEVQVSVAREAGLVQGAKRFNYLLVADSAGVYRVAAPAYPYYDLDARRYIELGAAPLEIVARPGQGPAPSRSAPPPPPLAPPRFPAAPQATNLPIGFWMLLAAVPVLWLILRRSRPQRRRDAGTAVRQARGHLEVLDEQFRRELERLVRDDPFRDEESLADALRAAGVEASLALHVARVRERLHHALYGPNGATDADELQAEVQEVLRALLGERVGAGRSGAFTVVALVVLVLSPLAGRAQSATPERLYEAGALRAAADSFAARARAEPLVAAHWYGLGAAWYRLGSDARAERAWIRAARLAPRNATIDRALTLVPPRDALSARLLWVGPLTPDEALVGAIALWIVGWVSIGWRRGRTPGVAALLVASTAAAYGAIVQHRYHLPIAVTVDTETPMREAPYGSATVPRRLREGSAVLVERTRGGWLLVRHGDARGWVQWSELEPL